MLYVRISSNTACGNHDSVLKPVRVEQRLKIGKHGTHEAEAHVKVFNTSNNVSGSRSRKD